MGNDIEIRVSVANNSAAGITAVNNSLNRLRDNARDAGRGLDGLTARATAASVALRALKDSAQDASRALRSLNTAARNADGRMGNMSDRSRTLRRDTDDLDGSMRRLTTTMGGLRGGAGSLRVSLGDSGNGMQQLKSAALMLAPALIPIAASVAPIAADMTAAGVAVGAFGLAIAGQIAAVKEASDAQKKYDDAVKKHGANSAQAAQAEALFLDQVRGMDPASRRAAAGLSVLKTEYTNWSRSLAGDTMPVFTKGLTVAGGLLPKLTPMVKGASTELSRFMTILGGGVNSSGFSKFMDSFATFSTGALSKANDGLIRFMRTMSGGTGSSQVTQFMEYAKRVGPAVGETLSNLAKALIHLVSAASETGVSLLTVVNSFAKLVNAIPTGALATLLQFAVVFKVVKLAALGLGGAGGGVTAFVASLTAMRAASAAAGGGLTGLSAAFGTLSKAAKVSVVAAGIGLLVVALSKLGDLGREAPPDVDKLTTSLGKLGASGKAGGEAARLFGDDLGKLYDSVRNITDPSAIDDIQNGLVKIFSLGMADSTPSKEARERLDAIDDGLTNLVRGGKAKLAAQALKDLSAEYGKGGKDVSKFTGQMDDYKAALADQAFEQKLAAESMGLFGAQAQSVQAKLDGQKASADGLRQSIQALNDVNRAGLGGMIGFEAAIDAAATAARKNAGALSMTNGVLNLGSEKARNAASALQDLASKTDEAAASARESNASWSTVSGIYERGRASLIKNAEAMGLTKREASALANQILKIPNKTTLLKGDVKDLDSKIKSAQAKVDSLRQRRKTAVGADKRNLDAQITAAQRRLDGLRQKRAVTISAIDRASAIARAVQAAIDKVRSKTVTLTTVQHTLGIQGTAGRNARNYNATGGRVKGYAGGGDVQAIPNGGYVEGPGGPKSDSILALMGSGAAANVSDTEYVVQSSAVKKYGVPLLDALNAGRLKLAGFAKGGHLSKAQKAARAQADAENQARHDAMGELTISRFGHVAGYKHSEFGSAFAKPDSLSSLVNSLNQWRGIIAKSTHGGQEKFLLKALDSAGKKLLGYEKSLTKVTASLDKAKDKLDGLKSAAAQLSDSVKQGVLGSANITRGASGDAPVTTASVMGGLTRSRDQAKAFASALKHLEKKGLSKDLIRQLGEAGIEGGGLETAGALLGASKSEISSINKLQGQIGSSASAAGQTTADAVYKDAIARQSIIVKQLTGQQTKLTTAMDNLTKGLEKLVQAALGKKAKAGKAAGGIVGGAASGGMRGGLTWVGEHEPELLDLPVGSRVWSGPDSRRKAAQAPWASMLNVPRRPGAGGAASAGGGSVQPIIVHQTIELDGRVVARQIFDPLRGEIAHRGGNVQKTLGQGSS